jgi:hypothetical protein
MPADASSYFEHSLVAHAAPRILNFAYRITIAAGEIQGFAKSTLAFSAGLEWSRV